jgi:5-hydroxyisourate hydrolase
MISTHILDTSTGNPASGVLVSLEKQVEGVWKGLQKEKTNGDGRIAFDCPREAGDYRLTFGVAEYFRAQQKTPFFLDVPVSFEISDTGRKYHIPLLLSPYGFSTYRGS